MKATLLVFCALVCVASALKNGPTSAAAATTAYTPQDQVLAKQPYGNFACQVNNFVVTTDNPGINATVSAQDIRSAFENVATLEWAHIAQSSFGASDGRNDEKILSTPGGDLGEFIQAIEAFSRISGKTLSEEEVLKSLEHYLKVATREKFFYETDEKAYMKLAVATGCRNLHVAEMGGMKRKKEAYLEQVALPEHIGDPFIKFLAAKAGDLGMHPEYVQYSLAAFHKILWSAPSRLSTKLCYLRVNGPHTEGALVNIRTAPFCVDQGLAPMASQQMACPLPVFLNHPDAVKVFRRELVSSMTEDSQMGRDVMNAYNNLAQENFAKFWDEISQGKLPVYTVEFGNSSPLLTTDVSFVE